MRRDMEFQTEDGVTLRGWFYQPDQGEGPFPCVVMCHGFSATKEMALDDYAEVFSQGGLAALVYDNRGLGESDGEPRAEIVPYLQIQDYRDAISYAATLPEVDPARIGIWGSSYSGGHVVVVGAIDHRVKCVCSQVPFMGGFENTRRLVAPLVMRALFEAFDGDRQARYAGQAPARLPVVPTEPGGPAILPHEPARLFFESQVEKAPTWINEATLRSAELFLEYDPSPYASRVATVPFLLVVAEDDTIVPADIALKVFNQEMIEPKKAVIAPGEHFEIYSGEGFRISSQAELAWFQQWL